MAYAEKRGKTWRAVWFLGMVDGKRRYGQQGGHISRSAALDYAIEQENLLARGIDASSARQTWGTWCEEWMAGRILETSSLNSDLSRLRTWILPRWQNVQLNKITRQEVLKWVAELNRETPSAWTLQRVFYIFSGSLQAAVQASLLPANPAEGVKLPNTAEGSERAFTDDEVETLLANLQGPYRMAVLVMVEAGLRFGEMAGLHRRRVNLDRGTLEVVEVWEDEGCYMKAYPKGRQRRTVPISDRLTDALKLWFEEHPATVSPDCGLPHPKGHCPGPLVVTAPQGGALDNHNMRARAWRTAYQAAGLDRAKMHWLRHTFATRLAVDGVPMQDIASALGHSTVYVTLRYSHLTDSHLERVRDSLNTPRTDVRVPPVIPEVIPKVIPIRGRSASARSSRNG